MDERLEQIIARVRERVPALGEATEAFGEVSVDVPRASLIEAARAFKERGSFELLADWSCVDHLEPAASRFLVAAHLASVSHPARIRLRVWIPEGDETCPSLTGVWPAADFQEREMYDFFGIAFEGHPDLRRIFMPEDWDGHPQRKDYPLGGTNVQYHGAFIPAPDTRGQGATTTGYPGRLS